MNGTRTVNCGKHKVTFTNDGHGYFIHDKEKNAPGVTEILKATVPKPWLAPWEKNVALAYVKEQLATGRTDIDEIIKEAKGEARRISSSGADIGAAAHKWIEEFVKNPATPMWPVGNEQLRKACLAFVAWFQDHKVYVLDSERIVYSDPLFYCGTLDLLAMVDGEKAIVDLKARKTPEYFREDGLQMGGYALALEHETGEQINHGWLVALDKASGLAKPHYVPIRRTLKDDFAACVAQYRGLQRADWLCDEIKEATKVGKRAGLGTIKPDLARALEHDK